MIILQEAMIDPASLPLDLYRTSKPGDPEIVAANLFKQKFQLANYALILILLVLNIRSFIAFFWKEKTLFFVMAVLAATAFVSENPDRVFVNLFHLSFGIFAVWVYFSDYNRTYNPTKSACRITLIATALPMVGSFMIWLFHPDTSIDQIMAGSRYGGLSGNPNIYGGVCVIAAWALFGLIYLAPPKRILSQAICLIAMGIILFNVWSTGSATTMLAVCIVGSLLILEKTYGYFSIRNRLILITIIFIVGFTFIFKIFVQEGVEQVAVDATDAVGKDLTLTGRTDIWDIGFAAFIEQPILGWSYDNHETVKNTRAYEIPYNHYHNGFLDTLVVGGLVLGFVVILNFVTFVRRYQKASRGVVDLFPLSVGVITALILNLTEYSMFRSNSPVWEVYLICFVAVTVAMGQITVNTKKIASKRRKHKS